MGKKIIICSNVYPPNFIGGAELIAHQQAKMLAKLGNEVIVFAGDQHAPGERHALRIEMYEGLTVYRIKLTPEDYASNCINFTHRAVEDRFCELLDSLSPDIVHFHNLIGLSVGLISLAKMNGARTVVTLHDHWGFCFKNTIIRRDSEICTSFTECKECMPYIQDEMGKNLPILMRSDYIAMQMRYVDAFISPSQYLANAYIKAGFPREKFHIIWYGIDIERFSGIQKIPNNGFMRFTFIGYIGKHKGVHILLNALKHINAKGQIIVNIVGEGDLLSEFKQMVKSAGLDGIVRFWGKINDVERVLRETDVLILPSIWPENQPVTITEAMASRTAVIASRIGGIPELVDERKTGYMFEPGNSRELAAKMSEFILHPDLVKTFGDNAYKKIESNTLERQVKEILRVYEGISPDMQKMLPKDILIACTGSEMNSCCTMAMLSFHNNRRESKYYFIMSDWLRDGQFKYVKLLWVVSKDANRKTIIASLKDGIPLLVPCANSELKALCKSMNCGLYYCDALEAEACLEYIVDHEKERVALGKMGSKAYYKYGESLLMLNTPLVKTKS
ncbi:Glycosyltransferase [Methanocella conradii HZ254]|uniref:Glycosyltransferase n=1 Tax=Methanocella conradii (strain DSM 24694 / JCM 17849 / CGMCC 1.5162 / HZ254) TaxID=1041930 RepID=H8I6Q9_METCZ|nr:glycosyltransferase family 4 protein [Methanocella conradii]AFC99379.1 Glycosyltransferase [Methanocella conradii HZ254]